MSDSPTDGLANEEALAVAAFSGDLVARKLLLERHSRFLRRCVALQLPMPSLAAEIVTQTFVSAWNEHSTWSAGTPLRSWLVKIARGLIREKLQRMRRRPRLEPMTQAILRTLRDDLEKGNAAELAERFARRVERLSDDALAILRQKYRDDLSMREIAAAWNESETSMALRLFRIRQLLSASVAANDEEATDAE